MGEQNVQRGNTYVMCHHVLGFCHIYTILLFMNTNSSHVGSLREVETPFRSDPKTNPCGLEDRSGQYQPTVEAHIDIHLYIYVEKTIYDYIIVYDISLFNLKNQLYLCFFFSFSF